MSLSREEIIRMAIGTARENGQFRRCFLTDQDLEKIADIAYAAGAAAEREACALACEDEAVEDTGHPEDTAYRNAIKHAAAAIRARGNGGDK